MIPGPPLDLDSDSDESSDDGMEDVTSIRETIANWQAGPDEQLEFPSSFTALERQIVHLEAENIGLLHRSTGSGLNRRIVIRRPLETVEVSNEVNVTEEDITVRRSKRARRQPEHLNDYVN